MDLKQINDLAVIMKENNLTTIEIKGKEETIRLTRENANQCNPNVAMPRNINGGVDSVSDIGTSAVVTSAIGASGSGGVDASVAVQQAVEVLNTSRKEGVDVLSPTVGVFYRSSSPESAPFVQVGDKVKKGDVLCIIEAMKLMNEIPAETDGQIAEIYAGNGQVVEYDQPLFRIV